jgi:CHAT domain-containing protein
MSEDRKYELIIEVLHEGTNGVRATTDAGAVEKGQLDFSPLRHETILMFQRWLNEDGIKRSKDLEVLGAHLYQGLINGDISAFLTKQLEEAKNASQRLRLQLNFDDSQKKLIGYPWEYLYDPETKEFLATRVDLVLSRFMSLNKNRPTLAPKEDELRILVVVSKPSDLGTVAYKEVLQAVEALVKEVGTIEGKVQIDLLKQPTMTTLPDEMKKFRPHILHFIGHGRYNKDDNKGEIALIGAKSKLEEADWCGYEELVRCFNEAGVTPRLVFLEMCQGAETEGDESGLNAFTGIAPNLIQANIPAVVAMKYEIPNDDAIQFSKAFYQKLSDHETLGAAVQSGRLEMGKYYKWANRLFGTPVLYMHSFDGRLTLSQESTGEGGQKSASLESGMGATEEQSRQGEAAPVRPASGMPGDAFSGGGAVEAAGAGISERPAGVVASVVLPSSSLRRFSRPALGGVSVGAPVGQVDPDLLKRTIDGGVLKMNDLNLDKQKFSEAYRWLRVLENQLSGKSLADVRNALKATWEAQEDADYKAILFAMVQIVEQMSPEFLPAVMQAGQAAIEALGLEKAAQFELIKWLKGLRMEWAAKTASELVDILNERFLNEMDPTFAGIYEAMAQKAIELKS